MKSVLSAKQAQQTINPLRRKIFEKKHTLTKWKRLIGYLKCKLSKRIQFHVLLRKTSWLAQKKRQEQPEITKERKRVVLCCMMFPFIKSNIDCACLRKPPRFFCINSIIKKILFQIKNEWICWMQKKWKANKSMIHKVRKHEWMKLTVLMQKFDCNRNEW